MRAGPGAAARQPDPPTPPKAASCSKPRGPGRVDELRLARPPAVSDSANAPRPTAGGRAHALHRADGPSLPSPPRGPARPGLHIACAQALAARLRQRQRPRTPGCP